MANSLQAARLQEIDAAKGMAIILVDLGHIVARDYAPRGNEWLQVAHVHLYSFHMAFFFYLSGYVFFLTAPPCWRLRFRKTLGRLLPAYLLFAAIVYVAKLIAVQMLPVDRAVTGVLTEALLMVAYPTLGFASFLWFIVTLVSLLGLTTILSSWIVRHFAFALTTSFALHLLSVNGLVPELFALHQLTRYWFFFLLGGLCLKHRDTFLPLIRRQAVWWSLGFVMVLLLVPRPWLPTVAACMSIPAIHGVAANVFKLPTLNNTMKWLGRNAFTIFLMNSLALGLVRGIVLKLWSWDDWRFAIVAPILAVCGLILPIIVQRVFFSRWHYLDRLSR